MAPFLNLFKVNPQTPGYERQAGGANKVNFFATNPLQKVSGGNAVGGSSNGTGELQSNYGDYAYAGAYKGLGNGIEPVGKNFDTLRDLGIYGF